MKCWVKYMEAIDKRKERKEGLMNEVLFPKDLDSDTPEHRGEMLKELIELVMEEHQLRNISPDDAKYAGASSALAGYLSAEAEWLACAYVQKVLLETRAEFDKAGPGNVDEMGEAYGKVHPFSMALIESKVTRHDQLAVIEEIGRYVSEETKSLLHPGTTSYDILDTARSYLFKGAWNDVMRPEIAKSLEKLCELSNKSLDVLQVGRTHLQQTSPVLFGQVLSNYAARIADRTELCDQYFDSLRGKVSGMVGTGAGIEMVIGDGLSIDFEEAALEKLGLEPDYSATQIVQKERLADVGHGLTSLMHVVNDFANDIRLLYMSEIKEVTSRDNAARLGGSSTDALKNNPINYENIAGKATVVESGMRVLYELITSDLQRDLRSSVQARYQPQAMMAETYESFTRLNRALKQLSINDDQLERNLEAMRRYPSEAMVTILRGEGWVHSEHGVGHEFVRVMGQQAQKEGKSLIEKSREDREFELLYESLPMNKQEILNGGLEFYTGSARQRALMNIAYALDVAKRR